MLFFSSMNFSIILYLKKNSIPFKIIFIVASTPSISIYVVRIRNVVSKL